jgi:hypothetical protein
MKAKAAAVKDMATSEARSLEKKADVVKAQGEVAAEAMRK